MPRREYDIGTGIYYIYCANKQDIINLVKDGYTEIITHESYDLFINPKTLKESRVYKGT